MLSKAEKHCIDCGKKGIEERKRCKECAKRYNRERARKRNKEKGRYNYGTGICPICKKEMILWRKNQGSHNSCRLKVTKNYNNVLRSTKGNTLARQKFLDLGIKIPKNYVVHHLNENPYDNDFYNLILISRSAHNSLHRKLQYHRSIWLKNHNENSENCWNILRDHLTTAWLEMTNANVIKINDIGQSAAEFLSENKEKVQRLCTEILS